MKRLILSLLILSFFSTQSIAATTWSITPGRTQIEFNVKHLLFFNVKGKFKKFTGTIVAPGDDLSNASIEGTIAVDSIYTGIDDRDTHLHSEDFFAAEQYPEISFTSKSVKKISDCEYIIIGDLTMRGITKEVELKAKCINQKTLPNGKQRMDLVATGSLNRFDYGLRWNELMETGRAIVGKNVELSLKLALIKD